MKVFQDFISKFDSTEKHESNFGNFCMKKGGSFQKERFSFLLKYPPRAYATVPKSLSGDKPSARLQDSFALKNIFYNNWRKDPDRHSILSCSNVG